jgi:hypothetical protein
MDTFIVVYFLIKRQVGKAAVDFINISRPFVLQRGQTLVNTRYSCVPRGIEGNRGAITAKR